MSFIGYLLPMTSRGTENVLLHQLASPNYLCSSWGNCGGSCSRSYCDCREFETPLTPERRVHQHISDFPPPFPHPAVFGFPCPPADEASSSVPGAAISRPGINTYTDSSFPNSLAMGMSRISVSVRASHRVCAPTCGLYKTWYAVPG